MLTKDVGRYFDLNGKQIPSLLCLVKVSILDKAVFLKVATVHSKVSTVIRWSCYCCGCMGGGSIRSSRGRFCCNSCERC